MNFKKLLLTGAIILILQSCQQQSEFEDTGGGVSENYCTANGFTAGSEVSVCSTNSVYSPSVNVTGTAKFYKRDVELAGATPASGLRLGAEIGTPLPIRFAEIRVLDSGGNLVQCGKTDGSGNLKALNGTSTLTIPSSAGAYTVEVLARSNHAMDVSATPGKSSFQLLSSVKVPCSESVHKITGAVNSTGSGSYNLNITATANENSVSTVPGGAFNIYNNVVSTYEYLAENTGTSSLSCLSPKLHVYWAAGFNPGQLIDPYSDPADVSNISFYVRGYNELYINGGKLGNVSSEDTDQFDDAVIIHEIGHRIEDVCAQMDSPGGTHFGLFRIDPRLAWSEGWGNYIGAHIIRNKTAQINPNLSTTFAAFDDWKFYLDTYGYHDGSVTAGDQLISIDLTKSGSNPEIVNGYYRDKVDSTAYPGEGHFREVSVARSLFKISNTCTASTCIDHNYFPQMWKAFERDSAGVGMGKSSYPFRSSIRFWNRLNNVFTNVLSQPFPADIDTVLNSDEAQQRDGNSAYIDGSNFTTWVPYGIKLTASGVSTPSAPPCTLKLQPRNETDSVTYGLHDQRYSSHFYYFDRTVLPSVTSLKLTATKVAGTSVDIDLMLFDESYRHPGDTCQNEVSGNCTSWAKNTSSTEYIRADQTTIAAGSLGGTYMKTITSLNTLSSATAYLLNIRAFTSGKNISSSTEYSYTLTTQTGEYLCPSATF